MENTTITIRMQARDGMFLGPDSFNGAVITVTDALSGAEIASGITSAGDSGKQVTAANSDTSPYPIVTPGDPVRRTWVQADATTVNFTFSMNLDAPKELNVRARIPLPPAQGDQFVAGNLLVRPNGGYDAGAGFVLEAPGLWVQPELVNDGLHLRVRAKVTMMCGCMINDAANSLWVSGDFLVQAQVYQVREGVNLEQGSYPMTFQINSQFFADIDLAAAGEYLIVVTASQLSQPNVGEAKASLQVIG